MDIRTLELYLHLCDSLHFGQTAQQMHVSPSTLSRALFRLEQEVGSQLLQRDNRHVSLTSAGRNYRQFAQQTLTNWHQLKQQLDNSQQLSGSLHLFCSVTAAYSHLPHLLDKFRHHHPLVEISLTTGDAAFAADSVKQQQVDIAIAALDDKFPQQLHFTQIDNVAMQIIAPRVHSVSQRLVEQNSIDWQSLPFILPERGLGRTRAKQWFQALDIKPNIYANVAGHEAIVSMVALGCGIAISPDAVINNSPVKERVQVIESPISIAPFELGCCCKKNRLNEVVINAFFALL